MPQTGVAVTAALAAATVAEKFTRSCDHGILSPACPACIMRPACQCLCREGESNSHEVAPAGF